MNIQLHPDQEELLNSARGSIRGGNKSVLIQASTGSGKTIISASMVKSSLAKGTRSIFVVPRRELLKQTSATYNKYDIPHSYVSAGREFNPFAQSFIATAGTLVNRLKNLDNIKLVVIDECHISGAGVDAIIKHYQTSGAVVIGLSATPTKLSGQGMGTWFSDMVCGKSTRWLIDNKRLSDYRPFAIDIPDLSMIKTLAGDFNQGQLSAKMEQDRVLVGSAVAHYKSHAMGKLGVTYTTSRKHSEIVAEEFRRAGVPASHIDGTMDDTERSRIIKAFANRELMQLVNCDLLTTGFDLASSAGVDVSIECLTDLQPTKSIAKQLQKWGRVLRYKDYPAIIFDHAGNIDEHLLPCTEREWTLAGQKKGKREGGEKAIAVQSCSVCYWCCPPTHDRRCPNCGHIEPIKERKIDQVDGELQEIDPKTVIIKQKKQEQGRAQTLEQLIAVGKARGMSNAVGWANHVFNARKGK